MKKETLCPGNMFLRFYDIRLEELEKTMSNQASEEQVKAEFEEAYTILLTWSFIKSMSQMNPKVLSTLFTIASQSDDL